MGIEPLSGVTIRRGFTEIDEGQVHYRQAGVPTAGKPALIMFHASPGSAKTLEPLMRVLGAGRHVIAPDTLGNGDSCPPRGEKLDLAYFAQAHLRAINALGIDRFDAWGAHTGANIACEISIGNAARVRSVIIDGIGLYDPHEQAELLANYLPDVRIDHNGSQFHLLWHFVRDAFLFWPWYRKDAGHRRPTGLPDAEDLHDKAVEVFKAARTFHLSYRAALSYPKEERLPLMPVPTLVTCASTDMLHAYFDRVCALMPAAQSATTPGFGSREALLATAALFESFLDAQDRARPFS